MKNGNQQMTNAPVMMARVFAALRSRLESAFSFVFLLGGWWCVGGWYWHEPRSTVGGSGSSPLPKEPFSGDVLVEDTLVKAVVVVVVVASEMVGSGRPMTPTTAAAMPPLPPAAPAAQSPATNHPQSLQQTHY